MSGGLELDNHKVLSYPNYDSMILIQMVLELLTDHAFFPHIVIAPEKNGN